MPKLPDIEYSVQIQGPPNPAQAFGALAAGVEAIGEAGNTLSLAFAAEQAKTQISEASLIYEQGLAQDEAVLSEKPYLSRKVVEEALGGQVPPDVQSILERHEDQNAETVPTWEVGAAIHAASAKRLGEESAKLIYSPRARAEYERRLAADSLSRNVRVNQKMLAQGADLGAAKDLALADQRSRFAQSDSDWARITTDIQNSGWLTPAQKEKAVSHYMGLRDTQGKQRTAAGLAEGALQAGRDGITPWVDAGKATETFEKSVVGKDPLIVEDARQKFTLSLEQNERARQNADAQPLGRLEVGISRGLGLSRISDDYKALSPKGQATAEKMYAAKIRERKSEGSEERRIQAEYDRDALAEYGAIPSAAERAAVTDEQIKAQYPNATDRARNGIRKSRNHAIDEVRKDGGIGVEQRADLMRTEMAPLGYSKDKMNRVIERVEGKMAGKYTKEKPATNEDVLGALADQVLMGTTPGYVYGTNEEERFSAEVNSLAFTPLPTEKQPAAVQSMIRRATAPLAAKPAAAAPPAAPVPGQPKKGAQVDGRTIGLAPGRLFENTGRTDPNGRVIWKVVK